MLRGAKANENHFRLLKLENDKLSSKNILFYSVVKEDLSANYDLKRHLAINFEYLTTK